MPENRMRFRTAAIHAGHDPADHLGAVMTPIYQTSTFAFRGVDQPGPVRLFPQRQPDPQGAGDCLAALEGGTAGFAFATGMAAETTVLMMFEPGDTSSSTTTSTAAPTGCSSRVSRQADRGRLRRPARRRSALERALRRRRQGRLDRIAHESADEPGGSARRSRRWRTRTAPSPSATTPSCRPISSARSNWASTSWCTRPPSTSTATPTWSAAPSW